MCIVDTKVRTSTVEEKTDGNLEEIAATDAVMTEDAVSIDLCALVSLCGPSARGAAPV